MSRAHLDGWRRRVIKARTDPSQVDRKNPIEFKSPNDDPNLPKIESNPDDKESANRQTANTKPEKAYSHNPQTGFFVWLKKEEMKTQRTVISESVLHEVHS
ncbi:MAG TPA: hypothetical protein IAC52_03075 [Candidatus Enteromonas pullicola]|uniref:Uncharacterized protein n=1 Tax=Candidatus Alloenteromonas pullicola TaxID=2840784 RepID=A0A9D1LNR2_9FIRM|nr:hypothetical protein [Candidatus Enteromonas pullicola]